MTTKFERMGEKTKKYIETQKKKLIPLNKQPLGPQAGKTARKNVKRG